MPAHYLTRGGRRRAAGGRRTPSRKSARAPIILPHALSRIGAVLQPFSFNSTLRIILSSWIFDASCGRRAGLLLRVGRDHQASKHDIKTLDGKARHAVRVAVSVSGTGVITRHIARDAIGSVLRMCYLYWSLNTDSRRATPRVEYVIVPSVTSL